MLCAPGKSAKCDGHRAIIYLGMCILPCISEREIVFSSFFPNDVKWFTLNERVSK